MTRTTKSPRELKKSSRNSRAFWKNSSDSRSSKINKLLLSLCFQRTVLLRYLQAKVEANDMHAVSDAANDIREVDAKLDMIDAVSQL